MRKPKINIVTLGCSKNKVDSERLAATLSDKYNIVHDSDKKSDIVIINTCGFIGDRNAFSPELLALMNENEEESKDRPGMVLNLAMNYGGRAELATAVQNIARDVKSGRLAPEDVCEQTISDYLYTKGQPDPDLIIRPSGEHRTSNFLLWQSAYSEYVIMDVLWPDFTEEHLNKALLEYAEPSVAVGVL